MCVWSIMQYDKYCQKLLDLTVFDFLTVPKAVVPNHIATHMCDLESIS